MFLYKERLQWTSGQTVETELRTCCWTSLGMSCLKSGFEQTVVQVEQDGNSDVEVFHNGSPQRFSKVTLNSARRSSHPSVRREKRLSRLRQRPCGKPLRPKKHRRNAEDLCIFLSYLYHTHRDTYIYIHIKGLRPLQPTPWPEMLPAL